MYRSVYDIRSFYNSKIGRVVRRILQQRIHEFWPDVKGMRMLGVGYSVPYLRSYILDSERVFAMMPVQRSVHSWPQATDEKNLVCVAQQTELPFETNSIDRVLIVHDIEFSEQVGYNLQEIWRVLKSNGRLLLIVPNRSGFWSRADWSPFGQGSPYSGAQIHSHLHENLFVHERTEEALFMPPIKFAPFLKTAGFFEEVGKRYFPFGAGVHIVEASKQLYGRIDHGVGARASASLKGVVAKPVSLGSG